jgi:hypothetical protein
MPKQKISAKELISDIRAGMNDAAIMQKYGLSLQGLQSAITKLLEKGLVKQSELDLRPSNPEKTVKRPTVNAKEMADGKSGSASEDLLFCPKCGEKRGEGASFCARCGNSLTITSAETTDEEKSLGTEGSRQAPPHRVAAATSDFFCPSCKRSFSGKNDKCPVCGLIVSEYHRSSPPFPESELSFPYSSSNKSLWLAIRIGIAVTIAAVPIFMGFGLIYVFVGLCGGGLVALWGYKTGASNQTVFENLKRRSFGELLLIIGAGIGIGTVIILVAVVISPWAGKGKPTLPGQTSAPVDGVLTAKEFGPMLREIARARSQLQSGMSLAEHKNMRSRFVQEIGILEEQLGGRRPEIMNSLRDAIAALNVAEAMWEAEVAGHTSDSGAFSRVLWPYVYNKVPGYETIERALEAIKKDPTQRIMIPTRVRSESWSEFLSAVDQAQKDMRGITTDPGSKRSEGKNLQEELQAKERERLSLLIGYAKGGLTDRIKDLIADGMNVNAQDEAGFTALMWAAYFGQVEVAQLLLENGADCKAKNAIGQTAMDQAKKNKLIQNDAIIYFLTTHCARE